jgi:hypothetical protein
MSAAMAIHAADFDPALAAVVDREAAACGESVEHYIQRAVAARIVADLARRRDPSLGDLQRLLADAGLKVSDLIADARDDAILGDPNRVAAVERTGLLDSAPDPAFDRIVGLAAKALGAPSASLSLVDRDRLFILSSVGLADHITTNRQVPLVNSITKFAVASGHTLMVEDASIDSTFNGLPFVRDHTVISYLGVPLINPDGYAIGSLAVWDSQPRHWSTGHVDTLHSFGSLAWQRIFGSPQI